MGNSINVVPIWNNSGFRSGIYKFNNTFTNKTNINVKIKIIVKANHNCWLFLFKLKIVKFSVNNLTNKKKIEDKPKLTQLNTITNYENGIKDHWKKNYLENSTNLIQLQLYFFFDQSKTTHKNL